MMKSFTDELRLHPWMWRGVLLTGSAALGTALPDILTLLRQVFA